MKQKKIITAADILLSIKENNDKYDLRLRNRTLNRVHRFTRKWLNTPPSKKRTYQEMSRDAFLRYFKSYVHAEQLLKDRGFEVLLKDGIYTIVIPMDSAPL